MSGNIFIPSIGLPVLNEGVLCSIWERYIVARVGMALRWRYLYRVGRPLDLNLYRIGRVWAGETIQGRPGVGVEKSYI